jgi:hypothetical protein
MVHASIPRSLMSFLRPSPFGSMEMEMEVEVEMEVEIH